MKRKRMAVVVVAVISFTSFLVFSLVKNMPKQTIHTKLPNSSEINAENLTNNNGEKSTLSLSEELSQSSERKGDDSIMKNKLYSGKNYTVLDLTKNFKPKYKYEIYDDLGKTVRIETVTAYPTIQYITDSILSIVMGGGTDFWSTTYFDTKNNKFSDCFISPLATNGNKVIYLIIIDEEYKLVIQDIFNKKIYYKEFDLDLSYAANPFSIVPNIEFLEDSQVKINYFSGENFEEKNRIISLD